MAYLNSILSDLNSKQDSIHKNIDMLVSNLRKQKYTFDEKKIEQDVRSFLSGRQNLISKDSILENNLFQKITRQDLIISLSPSTSTENLDLAAYLDPQKMGAINLPTKTTFYELSENQPAFVPVPDLMFDRVYCLFYALFALVGLFAMILALLLFHYFFGVDI